MFLGVMLLVLLLLFVFLWSDYMKMLIYLEFVSLIFISVLMLGMKLDYFSLNFSSSCLVSLVCESSMGFLLFIMYISMESELVKKMNLSQF